MLLDLTEVIVGVVLGGDLRELHLLDLSKDILARDLRGHFLAQALLSLRLLHQADLFTAQVATCTTLCFRSNEVETGGALTMML